LTQTGFQVHVQAVVFTLSQQDLKTCLIHAHAHTAIEGWSLASTTLNHGETLGDAAQRLLDSTLNTRDVYIQQLYTFGASDDNPTAITVAYFALVSNDKLMSLAVAEGHQQHTTWFSVYQLPSMPPSHHEILTYALTRLRYKIEYSAVAFELLPETFTFRELQHAYMIILNDFKLDKANFRKKIRDAAILEEVSQYRATGGRPARLYRFRDDAQLETKARRFFP
jgi:8-oxo-dGTP diphosphatase